MFLAVIGLACGLPVAIYAAESTSYKFYEQFGQDQQETMRESTTYQFRERDAADATSYKTTDVPPAVQNSSAAASTTAASTTNESGNEGGRRGQGAHSSASTSEMPANGQSSDPLREDSVSSAGDSAAEQTVLATTVPAAPATQRNNAGTAADSLLQKKDPAPDEATLHPGPGRLPPARQASQVLFVVFAVGTTGVLLAAITLLLTWQSSKAMMVRTFIHARMRSWFLPSISFLTQHLRKRKSRKSGTRWYQRLLSLLLCASLLSGTFATGLQRAEAATTAPLRHNYSGHLLDSSGTAVTAAHTFRFSYWKSADHQSGDTTGAGAINTSATNYGGWYETQSVTPNSQGYVSLELGNGTALPAMDSLTTATLLGLYLQVEVKVSSASDTTYELLDVNAGSSTVDRSSVLSVPFALNADMLDQRDVGTGSGSIPVLQFGGVLSKAAIPGGTNSGSFLIDADGSESTSVTLQFGTSLTRRLTFDAANDRFSFSNDLVVSGGITATGALIVKGSMSGASVRVSGNADIHGELSATGSIRADGNLTINDDQTSGDVGITFGQPTTNQTLTYVSTTGRFQFSRALSVLGTLSGSIIHADGQLRSSGSLVVNGATTLKSTLSVTGNTTVDGTTLTVDSSGNKVGIGTSAPDSALEVIGTASGRILHAQDELRGSGSLAIEGASTFQGTLTFGDTLADTIAVHAATWTFQNDTNFVLSGGVNGLSFDTSTLSIDAQNDRVGIGTTAPDSMLEVAGTMSGSSLVVGGGTTVTKILSAATTLDFGNTLLGSCSDLTMTVTGATDGDVTAVTPVAASVPAGGDFYAWVSSANTVTVRYCAVGATGNPASGTFRVHIFKY